MEAEEVKKLDLLISELHEKIKQQVLYRALLKTYYNENCKELNIRGNQEGLLSLASLIIELATATKDNNHHHID